MSDRDAAEWAAALERIKSQAATGLLRVTQHAQQERVDRPSALYPLPGGSERMQCGRTHCNQAAADV